MIRGDIILTALEDDEIEDASYYEIVEAVCSYFKITWCRSKATCGFAKDHSRGFANRGMIHLSAKIGNRLGLYRAMHEIGHVLWAHDRGTKVRWVREKEAETFAREAFKALGVPVPRSVVKAGNEYVERMRRWGDNVAAGRRGG